jgi:osmotically-inducible protein OsmY
VDIAVETEAGRVTLTGIVVDDRERGACEEVAAKVPGVASVENRIETMSGGLYRFPSQPRSSDD